MCEPVSASAMWMAAATTVGGALLAKQMAPNMPDAKAPDAPGAPPASQEAKAPDAKSMRAANGASAGLNAGQASTLLTGPAGVDPASLELGKTTLTGALGKSTLLGM